MSGTGIRVPKIGLLPTFMISSTSLLCIRGTLAYWWGDEMQEIKTGGFSSQPRASYIRFGILRINLRYLEMDCNQNFDEYLEDLFSNSIAYYDKTQF